MKNMENETYERNQKMENVDDGNERKNGTRNEIE